MTGGTGYSPANVYTETDELLSDAVLSNAKLKSLGFTHQFPTIDEGIPDVIAKMRPFRRR